MWVQTIDKKRNKPYYYYIEYFYTSQNKEDRYRVWTSNPTKAKICIWNTSQDLKDIKTIFGRQKVVGTY